jgi:FAD/FMN-containing dehydrogenase
MSLLSSKNTSNIQMSISAKTLDGQTTELQNSVVDDLRARIRGDILLADDSRFEDSRTIWNAMIDRQPALVVRPLGVTDVRTAVRFATEHDLLLCIKGGGHNVAGLAVADGALMLDMSLMRGVWVDPDRKVARAQAGCLLGDVDRETQTHGLAAVLGFVSNTGIAGLTLGGGFGYLTRRHGWTSDNVVSIEMVTLSGDVVRASESQNSDLFWALRGGGGNFGVVTGFEYKLFPVGPEIVGGLMAFPGERAEEVMSVYREVVQNAEPEGCAFAGMRIAPPAPWISPEAHGKPIALIGVCHTGHVDEGKKFVEPFKAIAGPVGDVVQPRSYVSQQSILDATQPKGRRYYWKSDYLPGISADITAALLENSAGVPSEHSAILLFPLDGRLEERPQSHSAVGNRDARFVFNVASSWDDASADESNITWTRAVWRDLNRFSTGGTYINFLTEEETGDRLRDAWGDNYDRLQDVKRRWDAENRLRVNKNILP